MRSRQACTAQSDPMHFQNLSYRTPPSVLKSMRSNRGAGTAPERTLRSALWRSGERGFRKNVSSLPGTPDVVFPTKKLAVFLNGCFWHACPYCKKKPPKNNRAFWIKKFSDNKARDKKKSVALRKSGWMVITVWECQLRKIPEATIARIKRKLS